MWRREQQFHACCLHDSNDSWFFFFGHRTVMFRTLVIVVVARVHDRSFVNCFVSETFLSKVSLCSVFNAFSCNSVRNYLSFYNDFLNSANKPLTQMQPLCLLLEVNTIRYIVHKTVTTAFSSEPFPIHCVRNFLETF